MPFLFIDYDQGAGGEFFSAGLSKSSQCAMLVSERLDTRTKVYDKFDQEFLNHAPKINKILSSDPILYDIVLSHRQCMLAKKLLGNFKSLRISLDTADDSLQSYRRYQQISKVLLAKLPPKIFIGEIKMLARDSTNPNFLKQIKKDMDSLDIRLIYKNIEPTKENREKYMESMTEVDAEPDYPFDLVIPYEDLFFNTAKIKENIFNAFGIEIVGNWLDTYRENYEIWLAST